MSKTINMSDIQDESKAALPATADAEATGYTEPELAADAAEAGEMSDDEMLKILLDTEDVQVRHVFIKRFGFSFTVRSISSEKYRQMERRCRYPYIDKRTHETKEKVDQDKLSALLIAEACVKPNFSAPALFQKYNTTDPTVVINKRLLIGEINILSDAIMAVSGFDTGLDDVKN